MKEAVGTSLMIISLKSLIGFLGDLGTAAVIDWRLLLSFSGLAGIGIFIGSFLSNYIEGRRLQVAFGGFVLVMGSVILLKEIL